jgi:hypothetical protein
MPRQRVHGENKVTANLLERGIRPCCGFRLALQLQATPFASTPFPMNELDHTLTDFAG